MGKFNKQGVNYNQANKEKHRKLKRERKLNGVVMASPLKPQSKLTNVKWLKKQAQKKKFAEKDKVQKQAEAVASAAGSKAVEDVEMEDARKKEKKEKAKLNKKARKDAAMKD